jgi:hypothetical protein
MSLIFTEVFPVCIATLPSLFTYKLITENKEIATMGWKLAYRLKSEFNGHWVWSESRIIGDKLILDTEIMKIVEILWQEQPEIFKNLQEVVQDLDFEITTQVQADFVAFGLFSDIDKEIKSILMAKACDIGKVRIERTYSTKAWVVDGRASISISVDSKTIYKEDLKAYLSQVTDANKLVGLMVADKNSSFKDEIVSIVGRLGTHRTRLLNLTKKAETRSLISNASDEEIVVSVGKSQYHYLVSGLRIIIRAGDYKRFGVDSRKALNVLKIEPKLRSELVKLISEVAKKRNWIENAYSSSKSSDIFLNSEKLKFISNLCFGSSQLGRHEDMLSNIQKYGVYKIADRFSDSNPIRIAFIKGLNTEDLGLNLEDPKKFCPALKRELKKLKFNCEYVGLKSVQEDSRVKIEDAVNILEEKNPDIILAFFDDDSDAEGSAYYDFKSIAVGRGIPSQYIEKSTTSNTFALGNIALGIIGKTGNTPFTLAKPLDYADLVIGIDVSRQKKQNLAGSVNATAIARIYFANGELLRYRIHDAPLEGETIPENVLKSLFPINEFKGKRVVIHRDGLLRGNEREALKSWAKEIGAEFYLVEVIKDAVPRIYSYQEGEVLQPSKGDVFKLSDTQAFLVSSLPPFKNSTPRPLQIRTEAPFTIEQAINSVLSLTLLHYGSIRGTRSPVSIHFSDKIGYLALKGIKPKDLEGNIPYWL